MNLEEKFVANKSSFYLYLHAYFTWVIGHIETNRVEIREF